MTYDLRVRAYAPNGAGQGLLPAPDSIQAIVPLNDTPALTLAYMLQAPRATILGQPLELALEVSVDGITWTEPNDCRFVYLRDGRDPIKTADAWAIEAPGYLWRLEKARVKPEGLLNADGRREFNAVTVGAILTTFLGEAVARGALSGMSFSSFSATTDSNGAAWGATTTRTYDVGTSYRAVLQDLADTGWIDYTMAGRSLKVYKANTVMATDRTVGNSQVVADATMLTEAPFRRTWEGLADNLQVLGDEGSTVEVNNPTAVKPWGRFEDFITVGGVTDSGTLTSYGQQYQTQTADMRGEYTHGLQIADRAKPLVDFIQGDYVWSRVLDGTRVKYRVRQITLSKDAGPVGGNIVLNDRFLEQDIRTARALDSITGGASSSGSSGNQPTPSLPGSDILPPAKVLGLVGTTSAYLDGTTVRAQITLDWSDTTTNMDGTAMSDLDHYEVQTRPHGTGNNWRTIASTPGTQSFATFSPYVPADQYDFQVRAVDASGNEGLWADFVAVVAATDLTPPVQTSQPSAVSTLRGSVQYTWDGKNSSGGAMDADLSYAELHVSGTNNFTPTPGDLATMVYRFRPGGGTFVLANQGPTTTLYAKLVPRDTSGNAGTASVQRSIVVSKGTDGSVPTVPGGWAPKLEQLGVGGLRASWPLITNNDTVTYDVYLAAGAAVSVFDATTLVGSTTGGAFPISTLPGGTLLPLPGVDYYLAVRVKDDDGYAAGAGAHGTAGPTQVRYADGLISTSFLYAGTVEAGQVTSGRLDADLVVASGSLQIGEAGALVLDPLLGITINQQDGDTTYMRADGSGNRFSGKAAFSEVAISGDLSIQGITNVLHGGLTVAEGITDPTSVPSIAQDVAVRDATGSGGRGYVRRGLWPTLTSWVGTDSSFGNGVIQSWTKTGTGGNTGEVYINTPTNNAEGGVAFLGGKWWVLGKDSADSNAWRLRRYAPSTTGTSTKEVDVRILNATTASHCALTSDGTSLYIFRVQTNNSAFIEQYDSSGANVGGGGASLGTWATTPSGFYVGNAGGKFAATRYVCATLGDGIRVYSTAGVRQAAEEWTDPTTYSLQGLAYDGGVFHRWNGQLVWSWSDEPGGLKEFGLSWYKLDTAPTPDVEYETRVGSTVQRTLKRFWRTTMTVPRAPNDPNVATSPDTTRVYAGAVGGTLYLQGSLPNNATDTVVVDHLLTAVPEQASSDYDALPQSVGYVKASGTAPDGTEVWRLDGDKPTRMGDLAWNTSGHRVNGARGSIRIYRAAAATIATSSWTVIAADTTSWADTELFTTASGVIHVTEDGIYHVETRCHWNSLSAAGRRLLRVYAATAVTAQTGALVLSSELEPGGAAGATPVTTVGDLVQLTAGQILVTQVWQNSGANLNVDATTFSISARKVG